MSFFVFIILLFLPFESKGQNIQSLFFPRIESVKFNVKIKQNLKAEIETEIKEYENDLIEISWPLPQDASSIKLKNKSGKEVPFSVLNREGTKFIIFKEKESILSYRININPQKKEKNWLIFMELLKEPKLYSDNSSIKIYFPEGTKINNLKLYLIHGFSENPILKESTNNNVYEAQFIIEPYSILSFESEVSYQFRIPLSNSFILFIDAHPIAVTILFAVLLSILILFFWHFYSSPPLANLEHLEPILPPSFLEKSFIFYKTITPEALAATLISWADKEYINFIEKNENEITIGKNKEKPPLPYFEEVLWDFLFKDKVYIDLSQIEKETEEKLVIPEMIELENAILSSLQKKDYVYTTKLSRLDIKSVLLFLLLLSLIFSTITAWLANLRWLIFPPILLNILIIIFGEKIPEITFLTTKGKICWKALTNIEDYLLREEFNIKPSLALKKLPWAVFFNKKEEILNLISNLPNFPIPYFESLSHLEFNKDKIRKIIDSALFLANYIKKFTTL